MNSSVLEGTDQFGASGVDGGAKNEGDGVHDLPPFRAAALIERTGAEGSSGAATDYE
ncbi:MAG TPA: hypothetical protein VHN36_01875 [Ilumatobacteraceae bacterium]|jgi:hypothetical protein|nr:hypothetical protein [Ilumatobacteraceae bacterium]